MTSTRNRVTDIAGLALVGVIAAGLVVLAVDGFTADGAPAGRTATGVLDGEAVSPISGFAFEAVTVTPGTTLTWVNEDPAPHTVTAVDGSFDSGTVEDGARFSAQFTAAGEYVVTCLIHPEMSGRVTVVQEG